MPSDRLQESLKAVIEEMFPNLRYLGFHRYSVVSCDYDAQTADLTPAVSSGGLPQLSKLPLRSAIKLDLTPGSSVLVGFAGSNPADPFLAFFDQSQTLAQAKIRATGQIDIGETAALPAARQGDMTLSGGLGTQAMLSLIPTGDQQPQPVMTMTPVYISFGNASSIPPTFPLPGQLTGIVSSGSALVNEA